MDREILCFERLSEQALAEADRASAPGERIACLEKALRLAQLAVQARARLDAAGPIARNCESQRGSVTLMFQNRTD